MMASTASSPSNDDNSKNDSQSNTNRRKVLLKWIQWIESLTLPQCCVRKLPASIRSKSNSTDTTTTSTTDSDNNSSVHIITGLERVLYGTQPAAEVVQIVGVHPPRYLCYMISGSGCDVIQFLVDFFLYYNVTQDASLCWMLSFGLVVSVRHTTHRYLVFGDYVGGYWRSLGRMYAGYSIIIVLSTIFNAVMTKYIHVPHAFAWIFTMLWTGIVNYFILKKLWAFGGSAGENKMKTDVDINEQEMAPMIQTRSQDSDIV